MGNMDRPHYTAYAIMGTRQIIAYNTIYFLFFLPLLVLMIG